jgi:hypothetical protein
VTDEPPSERSLRYNKIRAILIESWCPGMGLINPMTRSVTYT